MKNKEKKKTQSKQRKNMDPREREHHNGIE